MGWDLCLVGALAFASVWAATASSGTARTKVPGRVEGSICDRIADAARGLVLRAVERARSLASSGSSGGVSAREVSDMVDVVRLGLRAGLTFDASLDLFCANRKGALSDRMRRALFSWQVGLCTREEALKEASSDMRVPALGVFGATVCRALEFGAPVSDALAAQSREIREAHRAEVERDIERAPVKILIPTGTLILPALLLAILGPLLSASGMM